MLWITQKIGMKILFLVGACSVLILVGMMSFYSHHEKMNIFRQNELGRLEMARSVIHGLDAIMQTGSARIAQEYAEELKQVPGIIDLSILRTNGQEAFHDNITIDEVNWFRGKEVTPRRDDEQIIQILPQDNKELQKALTNKTMVSYQEENEQGELLLTFLTPIPNEKKCHLCHGEENNIRGVVKLTTSLQAVMQSIQEAQQSAIKILILGLTLLLLMVGLLIRKSVVQRISQVTKAMQDVAKGNLTLQVPKLGHDELSLMAESFNQMVEQLLHTYTGFQQERNKLSTIILSAREGIIVTDNSDHVVLVNPSAERLLGKTAQQIVDDGFLYFIDDPDFIKKYIATGGRDMPDTVVYNQRVLAINAARILAQDQHVIGSAALIRDITQEKRLEEELRHLSYTDKLTGLFNRRRMEELLTTEFERSKRYGYFLSFMILDVDHFKRFNDEHGHDQGDRVLQALAEVMRDHFRKTDFPCRFGGEEFCVILTSTPADPIQNGGWLAADRFRKRVEAMRVDGLQVTVSIGLTVCPKESIQSIDDLIKDADNALYLAKNGGRNRVVLAGTK